MAWHPERGLCDPFGGQTDLKNGVLRAVGDADTRFQEDALRILRGLRFASKLGFALEPETAAAMRRQVHRLDCIAAERIREELTGLLCGRYVQRTLMAYADLITSAPVSYTHLDVYKRQAIQYNPIEIANNLRRNNGSIPGFRPGKPTSDFITRTLNLSLIHI